MMEQRERAILRSVRSSLLNQKLKIEYERRRPSHITFTYQHSPRTYNNRARSLAEHENRYAMLKRVECIEYSYSTTQSQIVGLSVLTNLNFIII